MQFASCKVWKNSVEVFHCKKSYSLIFYIIDAKEIIRVKYLPSNEKKSASPNKKPSDGYDEKFIAIKTRERFYDLCMHYLIVNKQTCN